VLSTNQTVLQTWTIRLGAYNNNASHSKTQLKPDFTYHISLN